MIEDLPEHRCAMAPLCHGMAFLWVECKNEAGGTTRGGAAKEGYDDWEKIIRGMVMTETKKSIRSRGTHGVQLIVAGPRLLQSPCSILPPLSHSFLPPGVTHYWLTQCTPPP